MKHIHPLTQRTPAKAAVWQDIVCTVVVALNTLLGLGGASFPGLEFINDKCEIPTPNN